MKIFFCLSCFLLLITSSQAREDSLHIAPNVRLPRDSTLRVLMLGSISGFLRSSGKPLEENQLVLPKDALMTSLLLDELHGIAFDKQSNDSGFYTPYLMSIVPRSRTPNISCRSRI